MGMAEALSNFERRPLRDSQKHYALTLAYAPLMIMRVLRTFDIVGVPNLAPMVFQLGKASVPDRWDEKLLHSEFFKKGSLSEPSKEACDALDPMSDGVNHMIGPYGQNVWTNDDWVSAVPRPDNIFNVRTCVPQDVLKAVSLPQGSQA